MNTLKILAGISATLVAVVTGAALSATDGHSPLGLVLLAAAAVMFAGVFVLLAAMIASEVGGTNTEFWFVVQDRATLVVVASVAMLFSPLVVWAVIANPIEVLGVTLAGAALCGVVYAAVRPRRQVA